MDPPQKKKKKEKRHFEIKQYILVHLNPTLTRDTNRKTMQEKKNNNRDWRVHFSASYHTIYEYQYKAVQRPELGKTRLSASYHTINYGHKQT